MNKMAPIPVSFRYLKVTLLIVLTLFCLSQVTSLYSQNRSVLTNARKNKLIASMTDRFTLLITWPPESRVKDVFKPFVIGILSDKSHLAGFKKYFSNRKLHGKKVIVKLITQFPEIENCDLLFFSNRNKLDPAAILLSLKKKPVLTVGESTNFLALGGHISLRVVGSQLKFKVNVTSLKSSQLKASRHLLKFSEKVLRGK